MIWVLLASVAVLGLRVWTDHRTITRLIEEQRIAGDRAYAERQKLLTRIQDPVAAVADDLAAPSGEPRKLHLTEADERTEFADQIDQMLAERGVDA